MILRTYRTKFPRQRKQRKTKINFLVQVLPEVSLCQIAQSYNTRGNAGKKENGGIMSGSIGFNRTLSFHKVTIKALKLIAELDSKRSDILMSLLKLFCYEIEASSVTVINSNYW